jgi:hypothetical protein
MVGVGIKFPGLFDKDVTLFALVLDEAGSIRCQAGKPGLGMLFDHNKSRLYGNAA